MRKKDNAFGVAKGIDFNFKAGEPEIKVKIEEDKVKNAKTLIDAEIDPNRVYSPYYMPRPKKGVHGGTIGRASVPADKRKIQFTMTCSPAQKELFMEIAKKEKRKLSEFICYAVECYIEHSNLK